jgi:hypothetical protein
MEGKIRVCNTKYSNIDFQATGNRAALDAGERV